MAEGPCYFKPLLVAFAAASILASEKDADRTDARSRRFLTVEGDGLVQVTYSQTHEASCS